MKSGIQTRVSLKASAAFYEEEYDPYFNPVHFTRYASKRWVALQPYLPARGLSAADWVLDLGCGEGAFLDFLRQQTQAQAVGIDYSYHCCRMAHLRSERTPPVAQANAGRLPFRRTSFALVFSNALLHHVSRHHVGVILAEALRVARPGGLAVFVEPNRFHPLQIMHGLSRPSEYGTLRFSIRQVKSYLRDRPEVAQYWIRPVNTYLYIRQKLPPARLRPLFMALEDVFEIAPFCTHYMIIIQRAELEG